MRSRDLERGKEVWYPRSEEHRKAQEVLLGPLALWSHRGLSVFGRA